MLTVLQPVMTDATESLERVRRFWAWLVPYRRIPMWFVLSMHPLFPRTSEHAPHLGAQLSAELSRCVDLVSAEALHRVGADSMLLCYFTEEAVTSVECRSNPLVFVVDRVLHQLHLRHLPTAKASRSSKRSPLS